MEYLAKREKSGLELLKQNEFLLLSIHWIFWGQNSLQKRIYELGNILYSKNLELLIDILKEED